MPKVKTHRGARKRFRKTRRGKVLHFSMNRRHLLACKTSKRRRRLRKPVSLPVTQAGIIKKLLPYKD